MEGQRGHRDHPHEDRRAQRLLSGLFFDPASPAQAPATAAFVKQDATTTGNWVNTYGTQGYDAIGYTAALPSYATVTPSNDTFYTWSSSTTNTSALQNPANPTGSRIAACWYSTNNTPSFSINVNITDGQTHDLELYFLDYTNAGRAETVQISDATTGTVLDTETVSSFKNGVYLQWKVSGHVVITITKTAGPSALLSGLFFDQATATMSVLGGATSVQPAVLSTPSASPGHLPAAITEFPGTVGDNGPVVGPGAAPPRSTGLAPRDAAAVDPSVTLAGAGAVPLTTKRPRPDGRFLQAATRRLVRQWSATPQRSRLGGQGQSNRQFGI